MTAVWMVAVVGMGLAQAAPPTLDPAPLPTCADCSVLWIVVDTTRADALGCYGQSGPTTPNMDAMAARGVVFEQAYAQGPSTLVSVSSYMSGRYRRNTGMDYTIYTRDRQYHPLSGELTMVAEVLGERGWRTRGVVANPVIGSDIDWDPQVHQGFETWEKDVDEKVVQRGIELLQEHSGERSLVYLHLMGPHVPNGPRGGFEERRGLEPRTDLKGLGRTYNDMNTGELTPSSADIEYLQALYADDLWWADAQVGRVLDELQRLELDQRTLVVLHSDHGEALGDLLNYRSAPGTGEKPTMAQWDHMGPLVEQVLHVPLLMAGPGLPAGSRVERLVELVDVAPTLTAYLGIETEPAWRWEGAPLFGPTGPGEETVATAISDKGRDGKQHTSVRSLTHGVYTLEETGETWYYRLDVPGGPVTTVPPVAAHRDLEQRLQGYLDSAVAPETTETMDAPEGSMLEALRELGYME
ncbi:MAG: sulfatase [Myxococcota bacterium]|jgi:arylsulfatase A-like enzyme|nr:sulfatase [Myxococcota bacterium]